VLFRSLDHALKNNKRLVPVVYKSVDEKSVHPAVAALNWLYFRGDADFDTAFQSLLGAIDTDLGRVRAHTRLLMRAVEWDNNGRNNSFALRGSDLREAEAWLSKSASAEPKATQLQTEYILASRRDESRVQKLKLVSVTIALIITAALAVLAFSQFKDAKAKGLEAQRQRVIAEDNAGEARRQEQEATRNADEARAQQRRAEENFKEAKRQERIAKDNLFEATRQRELAEENEREARRQEQEARRQSDIALSRYLAVQSERVNSREANQLQRSALLAVEGLKLHPSAETDQALRQLVALLPVPTSRFTHEEKAELAAFSRDGKYLVTVRRHPESTQLWGVSTGKRIASLPHDGANSAAFSPDGELVATGSHQSVKVWKTGDGNPAAPALKVERPVRSMAISPDGRFLAAGFDSGPTVMIWDLSDGHLARTVAVGEEHLSGGVDAVILSPDGKYLVASRREYASVWALETGKMVGEPAKHNAMQSADKTLAVSSKGKFLVTAPFGREKVVVSDMATGQAIFNLPITEMVSALVFSDDERYLAVATQDKIATVWQLEDGKMIARMAHDGPVTDLVFSPDGNRLATASADKTARVWNVQGGAEVARATHNGAVRALAYARDGDSIATAGADETVATWKIAPGGLIDARQKISGLSFADDERQLSILAGDVISEALESAVRDADPARSKIKAHALSSDGKLLASVTGDTIQVWSFASGREIGRVKYDVSMDWDEIRQRLSKVILRGVEFYLEQIQRRSLVAIAFTPDGQNLLIGKIAEVSVGPGRQWEEKYQAILWNISGRRELWSIKYDDSSREAFSRDGRLLAIASGDTLRLIDVASGRQAATVKYEEPITALAFSPDSRYLIATDEGKSAYILNASGNGKFLRLEHREDVKRLISFSPDSRYLITASEKDDLYIWEAGSGRQVRVFEGSGNQPFAFSPGGGLLAVETGRNITRVWNVDKWQEVVSLKHMAAVKAVIFSADAKFLATAEDDGTARIWDASKWQEVSAMNYGKSRGQVVFSSNLRYLATAEEAASSWLLAPELWPLRPADLIEQACARLTRNLTLEEWELYLPGKAPHKTCPNLPAPDR